MFLDDSKIELILEDTWDENGEHVETVAHWIDVNVVRASKQLEWMKSWQTK